MDGLDQGIVTQLGVGGIFALLVIRLFLDAWKARRQNGSVPPQCAATTAHMGDIHKHLERIERNIARLLDRTERRHEPRDD